LTTLYTLSYNGFMNKRKQLSMKRLTQMASDHLIAKLGSEEKNISKVKQARKIVLEYLDYVWKNKEKDL